MKIYFSILFLLFESYASFGQIGIPNNGSQQTIKISLSARHIGTKAEFVVDGELSIDAKNNVTGSIKWMFFGKKEVTDKKALRHLDDLIYSNPVEFVSGTYFPGLRYMMVRWQSGGLQSSSLTFHNIYRLFLVNGLEQTTPLIQGRLKGEIKGTGTDEYEIIVYKSSYWAYAQENTSQNNNQNSLNSTSTISANRNPSGTSETSNVNRGISDDSYYTNLLDKILRKESHKWWINGYYPNTIHGLSYLRDGNGNATYVKAFYDYKNIDIKKEGWIELLCENKLPYYFKFWDDGSYKKPDINEEFSREQLDRITLLQAKFDKGNASELEVKRKERYEYIFNKVNGYPPYDAKDLVEAPFYTPDYKYREVDDEDLRGVPFKKRVYYTEQISNPGLKNIGSHRIIIRGIRKGHTIEGRIGYDDISIVVQPGETIWYQKIEAYFDEKNSPVGEYYFVRFK